MTSERTARAALGDDELMGPAVCSTTERVELSLVPGPPSLAVARKFIRDNGCPVHDLKVLDEALLLVTELVTNAFKYGSPPVTLSVECDEDTLNVRVRDGSTANPVRLMAGEQDEEGRGVALVELLSDSWGVEPVSDELGAGKAVWFRLRAAA